MVVINLHLFCALLPVSYAMLKVSPDEIVGGFNFVTTRFSLYIGEFEEDCSISATASILGEDEDICHLNSITTAVNNTILLQGGIETLNCRPEKALANAERMGALALVDVFPVTPGSLRYYRSIGQKANTKSIPFVQTGTEFLAAVILNDNLPLPINSLQLELSGCNDDSIWAECLDVKTTGLQIPIGVLALFFGLHSLRKSRKIPVNPSTKPRIFLLRYISFSLFIAAFAFIFGLFTAVQYSWLTGSLLPKEVTNSIASIVMGVQVHVILLTGIYWQALSSGLFKPHSRSTSYWSVHFYQHPLHYISYPLLVLFLVVGYDAVTNMFKDPNTLKLFGYILVGLQSIICVYIIATGISLISKLTEFAVVEPRSTYMFAADKPKLGLCKSVIMGFATFGSGEVEGPASADVNILKYAVWLTRCLLLFAIIMLLAFIPFPLFFFRTLPEGTLQGDESACAFNMWMGVWNLLKILAMACLMYGLGWVSSKPSQKIESTGLKELVHSTTFKHSKMSRKGSTLGRSRPDSSMRSRSLMNIPEIGEVPDIQSRMDILTPSSSRPSMQEVLDVNPGLGERMILKLTQSARQTRDSFKMLMRP